MVPRKRSEKSIEAECLYHEGNKLVDIARLLEVPEGTVRRWKSVQKWEENKKNQNERSRINTDPQKANVRKRGPPLGSKNALGNKGGAAPKGNTNSVTHGAYSKNLFKELLDEDAVNEVMARPIGNSLEEIERRIRHLELMEAFYLKRITQLKRTQPGSLAVYGTVKTVQLQENGRQGAGSMTTRAIPIDELLRPLYTELSRTQRNLSTAIQNRETVLHNLRKLDLEVLKIETAVSSLTNGNEERASNFEEALQPVISNAWPEGENIENVTGTKTD